MSPLQIVGSACYRTIDRSPSKKVAYYFHHVFTIRKAGDTIGACPQWRDVIVDNMYPEGYSLLVIEIRKTDTFVKWLDGLRDMRGRARILVRIERLAEGNPGDIRPVGQGVSELRIDYGPGYRVYFLRRGRELVILLAGGDKKTQVKDIKTALRLAQQV